MLRERAAYFARITGWSRLSFILVFSSQLFIICHIKGTYQRIEFLFFSVPWNEHWVWCDLRDWVKEKWYITAAIHSLPWLYLRYVIWSRQYSHEYILPYLQVLRVKSRSRKNQLVSFLPHLWWICLPLSNQILTKYIWSNRLHYLSIYKPSVPSMY